MKGVSFLEIEAWQRLTGVYLTPWDAQMIHDLSQVFVVSLLNGADKETKAPIDVEITQDTADEVTNKLFP